MLPFLAWTKEDEESSNAEKEEEEKKTFNSSYEIIVDYSEYSTIQVWIFFEIIAELILYIFG